jgi:hypothetical protein
VSEKEKTEDFCSISSSTKKKKERKKERKKKEMSYL